MKMRFYFMINLCLALLVLLCGCAFADGFNITAETAFSYSVQDEHLTFNAQVPAFAGLAVDKQRDELNKQLADAASADIQSAKDYIDRLTENNPDFDGHIDIELNYKVITDDDKYFVVDVYTLHKSGFERIKHKFYNFDKSTGLLINLSIFFNRKGAYVTAISDYIRHIMHARNKWEHGSYWVYPEDRFGFNRIKADPNFYINDKGNIVICFDKGEVAPDEYGSPEFEIPNKVVKAYLKKTKKTK